MAHRYGERQQAMLFPQRIEDYIAEDDPVRVYDAFVDALDWDSLDIVCDKKKKGCPQYDPKTMLKIVIYGYSYGIRSSRKQERALHHNLSFIWLAGGLKPDDRTIARFRRRNADALKQVLKQCARLCIKLDLIAGNTLFVDGTKLRANAGIDAMRTEEGCKETLAKVDQRIDQLMEECEQIDQAEQGNGLMVKLQEKLTQLDQLKDKVKATLETITSEGLKRLNTTDPDCARMHGRQGSHAGYNAQIVVDEQHGLIVSSDVVNENNDLNQFSKQIEQANETLDNPCKNAAADAGYSSANDLAKTVEQEINVIVPTPQQTNNKEPGPFDKSKFEYIPEEDCYICPEGHCLSNHGIDRSHKATKYSAERSVCMSCCQYGICTKSTTNGRTIHRNDNEELREKLAAHYEEPSSQALFSRRKETAELPFGHIKRNLGVDHFLLRGFDGVRAEMSILSSCFNLVRLIGILGVPSLIEKLALR
ncbi:IS1182 family transposase [Planctomycetota bacterium]